MLRIASRIKFSKSHQTLRASFMMYSKACWLNKEKKCQKYVRKKSNLKMILFNSSNTKPNNSRVHSIRSCTTLFTIKLNETKKFGSQRLTTRLMSQKRRS